MNARQIEIHWNGGMIGMLQNSDVDNFSLFGEWIPTVGNHYQEFLTVFGEFGDAWVTIGNCEPRLRGTVEVITDGKIEIKIRP